MRRSPAGSIEYTATSDVIIEVDLLEVASDTLPSLGRAVLMDGVYVATLQDLCILKAWVYVAGDDDRREKDSADFSWCLQELVVRKLPFIDAFVILDMLACY